MIQIAAFFLLEAKNALASTGGAPQ